jgi:hypothetical protein
MAYIFTAITGGQNVGQAFRRVNANLAAIEDNSGGDFLPLSGGTLTGNLSGITFALAKGSYFNTLSSTTLTENRIVNLPNKNGTVALLNDLTGFTTGDYLPLSGGTLTGNLVITNSNTLKVQDNSDVNSLEININSIDFRDDYNSVKTRLQYTPFNNSDATINVIDTLSDGYMVIVPTPSGEGGKDIRVNGSGNGWEYYDSSAVFLPLSGGTLTGDLYLDTNLRFYDAANDSYGTIFLDNNDYTFKNGKYDTINAKISNGSISIYDSVAGYYNYIQATATDNRTQILPDKDGTFAMLSDIPVIPSGLITGVTSAGTGNRLLLSGTVINNKLIQKSLSGGTNITITESNGTLVFNNSQSTLGFIKNTGDTITGLYTINDGPVDGARINMVGTAPIIYLEGTSPVVRLVGTDVIGKSELTFNSLNFDNNGALGGTSSLVITPQLTTTGTSILNILKLTGNTSGYIPTVPNISTNPNSFIKVNNAANGFEYGVLSGTGTVGVSTYTGGWLISGAAMRQVAVGSTSIQVISSITNNVLTHRTLSAGTGIGITQVGGDITIAANPTEGVLFNIIAQTTVGATTGETSVIPNAAGLRGSATLNASTATTAPQQTLGRRYRFTANGIIQSAAAAGNLITKMKLGSILLASSTTVVHNSIPANTLLFIDATFTVYATGSTSGIISSKGIMHCTHANFVSNGSNSGPINTASSTGLNTISAKTFDFTFQWGTSNANNTLTIQEASLEYLDI